MKGIKEKLTQYEVANLGFCLQETCCGHLLGFQPTFIFSSEVEPQFCFGFLFLDKYIFLRSYFMYSGEGEVDSVAFWFGCWL